ncbi:hypothetical protein AB3X52_06240 [Nocardioides sp. DS6]|uniref:Uncharacterized protein n=1 Tax=Nocardioides eburneus TaxID=3231482 RepID=A0ABV3SXE9_9ACTN
MDPSPQVLSARFETARLLRPVDLVAPGLVQVSLDLPGGSSTTPCPQPAPSAAVEARCDGPARLAWESGMVALTGAYDGRTTFLEVTVDGKTRRHRSRRLGRPAGPVARLALTLTGTHLTLFTTAGGEDTWTARARVDLAGIVDTRDATWLAGLHVSHQGSVADLRAGAFGQLGLRDLRLVTWADGTPYLLDDGRPLLTATSAGPGFFDTAHTSVWELDTETITLRHRADLFFRRGGQVYADHATHLLRDGEEWLVATSTWGDFDRGRADASVEVTLARSRVDLLVGRHVLDSDPLPLPTTGLASVGVWDPHLVRTDEGWLVGYVSARRFFDFHPVLASGPSLDSLTLRAAATDRRATEGTTLTRLAPTRTGARPEWAVLASDGRDNPRGSRAAYPVFDLDLRQTGELAAPYPSNIPWPTLVPAGEQWLLVGFDGEAYGGSLLGYGTHGSVVVSRSVE